jgi:hypothetical protein
MIRFDYLILVCHEQKLANSAILFLTLSTFRASTGSGIRFSGKRHYSGKASSSFSLQALLPTLAT